MPYILKESVHREIERLFDPDHVEDVRSQLASQDLPMERSAPPARVHAAILWLSKGDLKKFRDELNGARCDWRDTLVSAGLANEDWKDVLALRGIDCSDW